MLQLPLASRLQGKICDGWETNAIANARAPVRLRCRLRKVTCEWWHAMKSFQSVLLFPWWLRSHYCSYHADGRWQELSHQDMLTHNLPITQVSGLLFEQQQVWEISNQLQTMLGENDLIIIILGGFKGSTSSTISSSPGNVCCYQTMTSPQLFCANVNIESSSEKSRSLSANFRPVTLWTHFTSCL